MMDGYNGWKNKATWNIALWINNDEPLYRAAVAFTQGAPTVKRPYRRFIYTAGLNEERTPDGFKYLGQNLDYAALNEMMKELAE